MLYSEHQRKTGSKLRTFICTGSVICLVLIAVGLPAQAANRAGMDIEGPGSVYVDTLVSGTMYDLHLFIENDEVWQAMQYGFQVYSPEGADWTWNPFASGGYGPTQLVSVAPGSRMDPPEAVWDMTGLLVTEQDIDGIAPDSIMIGGLAMNAGLAPGPYEHMMTLRFAVNAPAISGAVGTICVDSCFVPPSGAFIFSDALGGVHPIEISGPFCWPVTYYCPHDSDGDGYGDPGNPENECPDDNCPTVFNPDQADSDGDGIGDACDNCPNTSNADQFDMDGDGIGYVCDSCVDLDNDGFGHPDHAHVTCEVDNCPDNYNPGQSDVDGDDFGDVCDNCPDISNGDQSDIDEDDIGDVCDPCPNDPDNDIDEDGLCADVDNCPFVYNPGQEDLNENGIGDVCEFICGDVNGDDDVNVGDVVYLIYYIFYGGPGPVHESAGDVDNDGKVNIIDVIVLLNYIFIPASETELICP